MIAFISGKVEYVTDTEVVIDCGGVGYSLICPSVTLAECAVGQNVKLHTYLQVREDAMTLFGFNDVKLREMFLKLTQVSGIGAKTACQILSSVQLSDLAVAIVSQDVTTLTKVKGIGKRTAERIVVELKEKIKADAFESGEIGMTARNVLDALMALEALGFTRSEASSRTMEIADVNALSTEEIVRQVLKSIKK